MRSATPTLRPRSRDRLRACASRHAMRAYAHVLRERGDCRDVREADQITTAANAAQLATIKADAGCRTGGRR